MNRKNIAIVLAALMVMSFAASAFAWGPGHGKGRGGCYQAQQMQQLTPEQQEKLDIINTEFRTKVDPLRKDMMTKHFELEALMVQPEGNEGKIKAIAKELGAIKAKMFEAQTEYRTALAEAGIQNFGGRGMGRGFGPCAGGGCPGYGQGNGNGNCPGGGPCAGQGRGATPCPRGYNG